MEFNQREFVQGTNTYKFSNLKYEIYPDDRPVMYNSNNLSNQRWQKLGICMFLITVLKRAENAMCMFLYTDAEETGLRCGC